MSVMHYFHLVMFLFFCLFSGSYMSYCSLSRRFKSQGLDPFLLLQYQRVHKFTVSQTYIQWFVSWSSYIFSYVWQNVHPGVLYIFCKCVYISDKQLSSKALSLAASDCGLTQDWELPHVHSTVLCVENCCSMHNKHNSCSPGKKNQSP